MALLQIAEPSGTPQPRAHRRAVGIDLGTTNSLVATVRHGIPVVLPDAEGRPLLPSIVHYGEPAVAGGAPPPGPPGAGAPEKNLSAHRRVGGGGARPVPSPRRPPRLPGAAPPLGPRG